MQFESNAYTFHMVHLMIDFYLSLTQMKIYESSAFAVCCIETISYYENDRLNNRWGLALPTMWISPLSLSPLSLFFPSCRSANLHLSAVLFINLLMSNRKVPQKKKKHKRTTQKRKIKLSYSQGDPVHQPKHTQATPFHWSRHLNCKNQPHMISILVS